MFGYGDARQQSERGRHALHESADYELRPVAEVGAVEHHLQNPALLIEEVRTAKQESGDDLITSDATPRGEDAMPARIIARPSLQARCSRKRQCDRRDDAARSVERERQAARHSVHSGQASTDVREPGPAAQGLGEAPTRIFDA